MPLLARYPGPPICPQGRPSTTGSLMTDSLITAPLKRLTTRAPGLRLSTDPGDMEHYGRDWTRRWTPAPLAVALPSSVEEVQMIMRWGNGRGVGVGPPSAALLPAHP